MRARIGGGLATAIRKYATSFECLEHVEHLQQVFEEIPDEEEHEKAATCVLMVEARRTSQALLS